MEPEYFKGNIFFDIDDIVFLTPFSFILDPFFDLWDVLDYCLLLQMTCSWLFPSPTNLYYIYMKFEYRKVNIFFDIDDFVFLTPFGFILDPFFDLWDVLE